MIMDAVLTQKEADALIALKKCAETLDPIKLPDPGGRVQAQLVSLDDKERFLLDVSRGRIDLRQGTNQLRTRQTVILLRLDYNGPPHRNPDGEELGGNHLHIYREGFADKWALPISDDDFSNLADHWQTLHDFMRYCNVTQKPNFQRGLFS